MKQKKKMERPLHGCLKAPLPLNMESRLGVKVKKERKKRKTIPLLKRQKKKPEHCAEGNNSKNKT